MCFCYGFDEYDTHVSIAFVVNLWSYLLLHLLLLLSLSLFFFYNYFSLLKYLGLRVQFKAMSTNI